MRRAAGEVVGARGARIGAARAIALLWIGLAGAGCGEGARPPEGEGAGSGAPPIPSASSTSAPFTDVTEASGVRFTHRTGASGRRYLPETMGSGCGFFDYDGDGDPDLYFANGTALPGDASAPTHGALYRNRGDGTFEEVTRAARLDDPIYGMGVAAGDVDNDGDADLFVSAVGPDRLYLNRGDGTFEEAAQRAGVADAGFGSSAAFLDYDLDGDLDLYAANYVEWSPETDVRCTLDGRAKSYCTPEVYRGRSGRLYRNRGDGTFDDVTRAAGVERPDGKALGVAVLDADSDGRPDLAIANDTTPNFLFLNRRDGTFREAGVESGMAYSESGAARGGMGIDASDYDLDGIPDILIGNFSKEMVALYRGAEGGRYLDLAAPAGLGLPTLLTLAFASIFIDYDLDGLPDVFIFNGHIEPDIQKFQETIPYAQPPQLFRNTGGGRFAEVRGEAGPLAAAYVGRGAAAADIDADGDLDLALTTNGGPAKIWRNESKARLWLRVRATGTRSNRGGLGVMVRAHTAAGVRTATIRSGSSYLSSSEPVATLGFGSGPPPMRLEIVWPGGTVQTIDNPPLNQTLSVTEPR